MDFDWTEQENEEYNRMRLGADALPCPAPGYFTKDEWKRYAELGVMGLSVPRRYGGAGRGFLQTAHAAEGLGRSGTDMGLLFGALAHLFACAMPIAEYGHDQTRRRMLPLLCEGQWIGANAITEDTAGSDAMAMTARAHRVGDHYELNGTKTFVSNGPLADVFVVYAVTDPSLGHLGVSAFAVERTAPGLTVGAPFAKTGLRRCPASHVHLTRCTVPAAALLGAPGQGAAIFQQGMRWERTCLFAAYLGRTERLLHRCIAHARQRRQFGRSIAANQAVSHRIARMRIRLDAARLLLWRACWLLDRDRPARLEVAMAKHEVAEGSLAAALDTARIFAGHGVHAASGVGRDLDDAVAATIFSGTCDIQLEQIAKELGL
ncbi:acyl-CoA dehydrogenase family protein [Nocardiopsis ansamitocini]|uniref:Acyl-CoA dehydrogenase n=1 Tax=Nocardiopsis ansamitocini TaxID=1670832 RepID=A0A9W6UGX6_9ACTN|nr:acyl-CoA dehydrogenase family protein [Nocardiopsis ansamitocini]GLU48211.1 acyl-CoA dehydrogenase [Nocardiopsis ansamitocini]